MKSANKGNDNMRETLILNPPPVELPAETHIITEVLPMPDPCNADYLTITTSKNPKKEFNFIERETRTVKISGMSLTWDESNAALMSFNGNEDIEKLEIYADILDFGAALSFPQTDITIFARKLKFTGRESSINTTPKFLEKKPALTVSGPKGIKGGSMELYLNSFEGDPGNAKPFIMQGTQGQPGGDGKVDKVGDLDMVGTPVDGFRAFWNCDKFQQLGGPAVVYYHLHYDQASKLGGTEKAEKGHKRWPKDGAHAQAAGKPGIGGSGGDLSSSIHELEQCADRAGGVSGPVGALTKGQPGGKPSPAFWQIYERHFRNCGKPDQFVCTEERHETRSGNDATAPEPDKPQGDIGAFHALGEKDYIWLHPLLLETAVQFYSDVYLNGYYEEAAEGLRIYKEALEAYQNIPPEYKYRFQQLKNEIEVMQLRLNANRDFFGNPAGWVPMLSFEANLSFYKNEVEESIQTLYLAYLIRTAADKEGAAKFLLQNSIGQLQKDAQKATRSYSDALALIPQLDQDFKNLSTAIDASTQHLKELEKELLEQAKGNVQREQAIRCTLRIFSGILQIIPVSQPALGTVGKGLDIVSKIDADKPLDTFGQLGTLFAKYAESNLKENAEKTKEKVNSTDTKDNNKSGDSAKKLIEAAKNLEPGLKEISDAIKNFSAPEGQVKAELEKLEAENREYTAIKDDIEELNEQKKQLAKQLTTVLQQLHASLNTLTGSLLQIDSMNTQLSRVLSALNHEAILYARKMQQSAMARLVKYQYYLVKAYQYRLLKACPGVDYQLKYVFDSFVNLLAPSSNGQLTKEQFATLMAVYQTPIKEMADSIITEYNSRGPQFVASNVVPLTAAQVQELNARKAVTINLMNMGYCDFSQECLCIANLGAEKIELGDHAAGMNQEAPGIITLMYFHSGVSTLRSNGRLYGFRPNQDDNVMRWGTTYNINKPVRDRISPIVPSPSDQSLLSVLIDPSIKNPEVLTQYRPSGWADITITKTVLPEGADVDLKELNLSFDFVFFNASKKEKVLFIKTDKTVSPYITLDQTDLNERKDGRDSFVRIFEKGTAVTITAQKQSGMYTFAKWIDARQKTVSLENAVKMKLDANTILTACYLSSK